MGIERLLENSLTYRYYLDNLTNTTESEIEDILSISPLVSLVISARNEGRKDSKVTSSNLYHTISTISSQKKVQDKEFEVIIVENNSTDDTRNVIDTIVSDFGFRVVPIFEEKIGVRYAKKRGFDQAFLHQIIRSRYHQNIGLIASTDADIKSMDDLWLSRIISFAKKDFTGSFGGDYFFDQETEREYPIATTILYEQLPVCQKFWRVFGRPTFGANLAIDPETYALIGGYVQAFNHGGDLHIGNKTVLHGRNVHDLNSWVRVNGRRLRRNPRMFVEGKGYSEGLEINYGTEERDIPKAEMAKYRTSRFIETIRVHFFLQSALKPNIVFNPENQEYFEEQLGGREQFSRFKESLSTTLFQKSPQEIASILMQEYLTPVFNRNKTHENYENLRAY